MSRERAQTAKQRQSETQTVPSEAAKKSMPSIESVKHILKLIAKLPPPLLPRVYAQTSAPPSHATEPAPPPSHDLPSLSSEPIVPHPAAHPATKEEPPSPPSQKRKREDEEPAAPATAAVKEEKDDSPPQKKPRVNGTGPIDSPIPAVRNASGATFASPSVPPSTPDSNGKHAADHGHDAAWKRRAQLREMIMKLVEYIRQTKKSSETLWKDATFLDNRPPSSTPIDNVVLLSLLQKTDSLLYQLAALWYEEEHMSLESELSWRSNDRNPPMDYSKSDDRYCPQARVKGAVRWNSFIHKAQELLRGWESYGASESFSAASPWVNGAIALVQWTLAYAHHWCAESHVRGAAGMARRSYKEQKLGNLEPAEYDFLRDDDFHRRAKVEVPRPVPKSITASRFHSDRCMTMLGRARSTLTSPEFLRTTFPHTWENCTRVPQAPDTSTPEAGEVPPTPPFDPWSTDPMTAYNVPSQPRDDAFFFQWPLDLRTPATHFCAFGRSLIYEIGRKAWPGVEGRNRPYGLSACFRREAEQRKRLKEEQEAAAAAAPVS